MIIHLFTIFFTPQEGNSTSINFMEFGRATRSFAVSKELLATFPAFDRFFRLLQSLHWLQMNCRNMNGEVTLEEVEQVMLLLLFSILLLILLQVVLLLSCRVRDIQISHWLGLLNAHWKVYPRGRDWLVYTGLMWVAMEIMTTMHLLCQC